MSLIINDKDPMSMIQSAGVHQSYELIDY